MDTDFWLTDHEIDTAMALISHQWSDVRTQTTLHSQRPDAFDAVVSCGTGDYVQIIHMPSASHWVAVTNILGRNRTRLFDSLGLGMTHNIKKCIASEY